jgi:methionine-rich copper-binding protein CopC
MAVVMKRLSVALGLGLGIAATNFAHAVLVEVTPERSLTRPERPTACARATSVSRDVELANHRSCSRPYKLRWQVLAADGHITRGEISFEVKQ